MSVSTEDLRNLVATTRLPEASLSTSFEIAKARNTIEDTAIDLADELLTARAKLEAAEKLAEALGELISEADAYSAILGAHGRKALAEARAALTAWENAK